MTNENSPQSSTVDTEKIDPLIKKYIYTAMGIGLIPIPAVDLIGLAALQFELIRSLSRKYNVPFKESQAKTIIGALMGGTAVVAGSAILSSLAKFIPLVGATTGALSTSITGGAVTYATGRLVIRHYEKGGTLNDFNTEEAKDAFNEVVADGKQIAKKIAAEAKDKTQALKKAAEQRIKKPVAQKAAESETPNVN